MKAKIGGREVELNIDDRLKPGRPLPVKSQRVEKAPIVLFHQLCSGKNAVGVTRSGHHYPNKRFAEWRADATTQLRALNCIPTRPIDYPVHLSVRYWAGDKRTRDVSGMLDALFHLLVHAKILKDDGLIRDVTWRWCGVNTQCPKVELTILPME